MDIEKKNNAWWEIEREDKERVDKEEKRLRFKQASRDFDSILDKIGHTADCSYTEGDGKKIELRATDKWWFGSSMISINTYIENEEVPSESYKLIKARSSNGITRFDSWEKGNGRAWKMMKGLSLAEIEKRLNEFNNKLDAYRKYERTQYIEKEKWYAAKERDEADVILDKALDDLA